MAYSVGVKTTSTLVGTERVLIDNGGGPDVATTTSAIVALANPLWTSTFATIAAASAYSPVSAPPLVWTEAFDTNQVPYSGAMYRSVPTQPSHFAKFSMTLNNATTAWYEIDEEVVTPQMLGAVADGVTNDKVAFLRAINVGRPVFLPPGTICVGEMVMLQGNVEIYGTEGSILQAAVVDVGIFHATGLSNFHIHNFKMIGASGSPHGALVSPMTFINCSNMHFHGLILTNWPDRGFLLQGTTSTNSISRNCLIENCQVLDGQAPMRFSGSCVDIGESTENFTVRNCIFADANGGVFIISQAAGSGNVYLRNHKVIGNRVSRMQQYGIIAYGATAAWTITATANNGSGLIRVTAAGNGYVTGDYVGISGVVGTTEANAAWKVTVIDANNFDLQGSVFTNAYVSGGTTYIANPVDIEIAGNVVEDIDGSPTATNGMNGNFGAAIYCVALGGIDIHDNFVQRCNLGTTTGSLAPGGIGINGYVGNVRVVNNQIDNCSWYGIYSSSAPYGTLKTVNNAVNSSGKNAIRVFDVGSWSVDENQIETARGIAGSSGISVDATTATQKATCNSNTIIAHNCTQPLALSKVTNFTCCNNNIVNEGAASTLCELVKFTGCDRGTVSGNNFDGGLSAYVAVTINAVTNTAFTGNTARMTEDGNARPVVSMVNTCTGTTWERANKSTGRMENISTSGIMHTADSVNTSGSKTRQIGDTILNTAPTAGGVSSWTKVVASAGGLNWSTLTLS